MGWCGPDRVDVCLKGRSYGSAGDIERPALVADRIGTDPAEP